MESMKRRTCLAPARQRIIRGVMLSRSADTRLGALLAILLLAANVACVSARFGFLHKAKQVKEYDHWRYIEMARGEQGRPELQREPPYCFRLAIPFVAGALTRAGLSENASFFALTNTALFGFLLLLWLHLRDLGFSLPLRVAGLLVTGLTQGAVRWFEYQYWMTDPAALFLVMLAFFLVERRRTGAPRHHQRGRRLRPGDLRPRLPVRLPARPSLASGREHAGGGRARQRRGHSGRRTGAGRRGRSVGQAREGTARPRAVRRRAHARHRGPATGGADRHPARGRPQPARQLRRRHRRQHGLPAGAPASTTRPTSSASGPSGCWCPCCCCSRVVCRSWRLATSTARCSCSRSSRRSRSRTTTRGRCPTLCPALVPAALWCLRRFLAETRLTDRHRGGHGRRAPARVLAGPEVRGVRNQHLPAGQLDDRGGHGAGLARPRSWR